MGVSTNGIIAFGVVCEEDCKFPWDEECDGGIDEWWKKERGFADIHHPWTPDGNYAPGWTENDPRFREYYDHRTKWRAKNPVPIELENYCSGGSPMYAITVPGVGLLCWRGDPKTFDPTALVVTDEQVAALMEFLKRYEIKYIGEPSWLLMSYWG